MICCCAIRRSTGSTGNLRVAARCWTWRPAEGLRPRLRLARYWHLILVARWAQNDADVLGRSGALATRAVALYPSMRRRSPSSHVRLPAPPRGEAVSLYERALAGTRTCPWLCDLALALTYRGETRRRSALAALQRSAAASARLLLRCRAAGAVCCCGATRRWTSRTQVTAQHAGSPFPTSLAVGARLTRAEGEASRSCRLQTMEPDFDLPRRGNARRCSSRKTSPYMEVLRRTRLK